MDRKRFLVLLLPVVILVFALLACGNTSNASTATVVATSGATNAAPTAAPTTVAKVGDTVKVGSTWQIKIISVKTSANDAFNQLKAGNIFLLIDVSIKNLSSSKQSTSSLGDWNLQDSTGQKYTENVTTGAPNPPDGDILANSLLRGTLAYEVPQSEKSFTMTFSPGLGLSGDSATWSLSVK